MLLHQIAFRGGSNIANACKNREAKIVNSLSVVKLLHHHI